MDSYSFKHDNRGFIVQRLFGGLLTLVDGTWGEQHLSAACAEILRLAEENNRLKRDLHLAQNSARDVGLAFDDKEAERYRLQDEVDALKLTADEIIAELSMALAILAGESLLGCADGCRGHFGPAAAKAVETALAAWRTLQGGNIQAVERVRDVELLLDTIREQSDAAAGLDAQLGKELSAILEGQLTEGSAVDTLRRIIAERDELTNLKHLHRAVLKPLEAEQRDGENLEETLARIIRERDGFASGKSLLQENLLRAAETRRRLEAPLRAVESENRSKCLELAEKAGEIRELREERDLWRLRAHAVGMPTKLLALLDSEEPPREALRVIEPGRSIKSARVLWRWLREQVHGTGKEG